MTGWRAALGGVALLLAAGAPAAAQVRGPQVPSRQAVQVSFGAALGGPAVLGTAEATLVRPNGSALTLFRTETRFGVGAGGEVDVRGMLTRRAGIEVAGIWLRQPVRTRITDDYERAPSVTVTQSLYRLSVEAAGVLMVVRRPKTGVFVRAGGGWMQEVADGATLAESGVTATVGLGMQYWFGRQPVGRATRVGVRLDARLLARSRGVAFDGRTWQIGPTGLAGVVFGF